MQVIFRKYLAHIFFSHIHMLPWIGSSHQQFHEQIWGKITKCLVNAANFNAKSMLSTRVIGGTFTNNENIHHSISLYIQLSGFLKSMHLSVYSANMWALMACSVLSVSHVICCQQVTSKCCPLKASSWGFFSLETLICCVTLVVISFYWAAWIWHHVCKIERILLCNYCVKLLVSRK